MTIQLQAAGEVWRTIPEVPGYQASDAGRIQRSDGVDVPMELKSGALYVTLPGEALPRSVAALILRTFRSLPDNHRAHHRNEDPTDCRLDNLYSANKHSDVRGGRHHNSVLTIAQVQELHRLVEQGDMTIAAAARTLGINYYTAYSAVRGRTWANAVGRKVKQRLTPEQVRAIRHAYAEGQYQVDIAKEYKLSASSICHIIKGRTWSHVT